jgi:hypothetical protein
MHERALITHDLGKQHLTFLSDSPEAFQQKCWRTGSCLAADCADWMDSDLNPRNPCDPTCKKSSLGRVQGNVWS